VAVPLAQWEAARSLALSWGKTPGLVIAPQAARIALAPTIGFLVQLIKTTSLASIIGFIEPGRAWRDRTVTAKAAHAPVDARRWDPRSLPRREHEGFARRSESPILVELKTS
jgi:ABC-type arginine transport system permease subunit